VRPFTERDEIGELLEGGQSLFVARSRGHVRDEIQPLTPVIEDDRTIHDLQSDWGTRRVASGRIGVTVQQPCGLIGQEAHESAAQCRKLWNARCPQGGLNPPEGGRRIEPTDCSLRQGKLADDVVEVNSFVVADDHRRRPPRHERVPAPAL
jgi:hypothetical protein